MSRVIVHSMVLTLCNLLGIWLGFLVFSAVRPADQQGIQWVVVLLVTATAFPAWVRLSRSVCGGRWCLRGWSDGRRVYGLAFAWIAAVFVPVHFVIQGYLTSFDNVVGLWMLQAVTNAIAIGVAMARNGAQDATRQPDGG